MKDLHFLWKHFKRITKSLSFMSIYDAFVYCFVRRLKDKTLYWRLGLSKTWLCELIDTLDSMGFKNLLRSWVEDFRRFTSAVLTNPKLLGYSRKILFMSRLYENYFKKRNFIKESEWNVPIRYTERVIKQKNKKRVLHIPCDELKRLQKKILRLFYLLGFKFRNIFGFLPKKSCYHHAAVHIGSRIFLLLDLKDAFRSVKANKLRERLKEYFHPVAVNLIIKYCTYNDRLPQGAPTSGWLLNYFLYRCDLYVMEICRRMGLRYSRYADNIVISSKFNNFDDSESVRIEIGKILYVKRQMREYLKCLGLKFNEKKTRLIVNRPAKICGYVVGDRITIPRRKRRLYRAMLYNHLTGKRKLSREQLAGIAGWLNTAGYSCADVLSGKYKEILQAV